MTNNSVVPLSEKIYQNGWRPPCDWQHRTAIHEASHASCALVLDLPFHSVTVIGGRYAGGGLSSYAPVNVDEPPITRRESIFHPWREVCDRERAAWPAGEPRRRLAVALAGAVGEEFLCGFHRPMSRDDIRCAAYCAAICGDDWRAALRLVRKVRAEAIELLVAHWPLVDALSRALMWRGTLTWSASKEIHRAIGIGADSNAAEFEGGEKWLTK